MESSPKNVSERNGSIWQTPRKRPNPNHCDDLWSVETYCCRILPNTGRSTETSGDWFTFHVETSPILSGMDPKGEVWRFEIRRTRTDQRIDVNVVRDTPGTRFEDSFKVFLTVLQLLYIPLLYQDSGKHWSIPRKSGFIRLTSCSESYNEHEFSQLRLKLISLSLSIVQYFTRIHCLREDKSYRSIAIIIIRATIRVSLAAKSAFENSVLIIGFERCFITRELVILNYATFTERYLLTLHAFKAYINSMKIRI